MPAIDCSVSNFLVYSPLWCIYPVPPFLLIPPTLLLVWVVSTQLCSLSNPPCPALAFQPLSAVSVCAPMQASSSWLLHLSYTAEKNLFTAQFPWLCPLSAMCVYFLKQTENTVSSNSLCWLLFNHWSVPVFSCPLFSLQWIAGIFICFGWLLSRFVCSVSTNRRGNGHSNGQ